MKPLGFLMDSVYGVVQRVRFPQQSLGFLGCFLRPIMDFA